MEDKVANSTALSLNDISDIIDSSVLPMTIYNFGSPFGLANHAVPA